MDVFEVGSSLYGHFCVLKTKYLIKGTATVNSIFLNNKYTKLRFTFAFLESPWDYNLKKDYKKSIWSHCKPQSDAQGCRKFSFRGEGRINENSLINWEERGCGSAPFNSFNEGPWFLSCIWISKTGVKSRAPWFAWFVGLPMPRPLVHCPVSKLMDCNSIRVCIYMHEFRYVFIIMQIVV